MKRVGVLGTLVWDRIWHPEGDPDGPLEQWGGIAYSLSAFAAACPAGWEVVPIVRVGADLADRAADHLRSLPRLRAARGVTIVPEPNNRVELRYRDSAERTERLTGGVSGWVGSELVPLIEDLDALYLNFISGFELDLSTATSLRRFTAPTYADLHSLFLGAPGSAARRPTRLTAWREWLPCFDAVQVSRAELALMGPERSDPMSLHPYLPRSGPVLALVTLGGAGAAYCAREGAEDPFSWPARRGVQASVGSPRGRLIATPAGVLPGDPTGCGDVWGSVLFAGLLDRFPIDAAVRRAHVAAAAKLCEPNIENLAGAVATALASSSGRVA